MRPAALILWASLLILWRPAATAQDHYTDCVDGAGNINNSTLVVSEESAPNIDGVPLAAGSEIAVFSAANNLCAGVTTWNESNTIITVWGNDAQTDEIEGMVAGEPLDIRVWDAAGREEYAGGRVEVGWQSGPGLNDSGLYQNDALMVIEALNLTVIDPPPVPPLLSPEDGAIVGPSVTLDWSAAAGATAYRLQVDDSPDFDSPRIDRSGIVLSASGISGLPVDVTWYWRVLATGEGGEGQWSEVRSFTTVTLPDPPGLTWPLDDAEDVSVPTALFWSAVEDAESFRLQVALNANFSDPVIDRSDIRTTVATDLELAHETMYHWRLRSIGASGPGSWSTSRSFTTEPEPPPSAPVLLEPVDRAHDLDVRPILVWSSSEGATGYRVQISGEFEFLGILLDEVLESTEVAVPADVLDPASTYWWRVRAISDQGEGDWSAAYSFSTAASTNREDVDRPEQPATLPSLTVYPNPVVSSTALEFSIARAEHVELRIFDLLGREIETLVSGSVASGTHRVEWRPGEVTNGIYIAHLQTTETRLVRTISVAR